MKRRYVKSVAETMSIKKTTCGHVAFICLSGVDICGGVVARQIKILLDAKRVNINAEKMKKKFIYNWMNIN